MKATVCCRTIDHVNADLARSFCEDHELIFQLADPRDAMFPTDADGIVFDLDYLAMDRIDRVQFVRRLRTTVLPYPVAIVAYDLDAGEIDALSDRGVLVARRVSPQLFRELAQMIDSESCAAVA